MMDTLSIEFLGCRQRLRDDAQIIRFMTSPVSAHPCAVVGGCPSQFSRCCSPVAGLECGDQRVRWGGGWPVADLPVAEFDEAQAPSSRRAKSAVTNGSSRASISAVAGPGLKVAGG
jgi:hypothetical protein